MNTQFQYRARFSRWNQRGQRRGVVTLLMVFVIALGALFATWVLSREHLRHVSQDMQQRNDALALAAAPLLLDEDLLRERPANQADDVSAARENAERYRIANSRLGSAECRLAKDEVNITPGFVEHPEQHGQAVQFLNNGPFNAIQVSGVKPVSKYRGLEWLSRFTQGAGNIEEQSCAVLDNRLVGFRPQVDRNAPVAPLAIEMNAWWILRGGDTFPRAPFNNGVREVQLSLGGTEPTLAVVGLGGPLNVNIALQQVMEGLSQEQLPGPDQQLGPVSTQSAPWYMPGTSQLSGGDLSRMAQALLVRGPTGEREVKAFPVYDVLDPLTKINEGKYRIVGFVAARVTKATVTGNQLRVELEPSFLVTPTAWTAPFASERNLYIHSLRIVR